MATAAASRTQEERTEAAKARLREAALELFGEQGYEATTSAAISLRAGFSRTLGQYHYPYKAQLAIELLEERIVRDNHLDLLDCPADASPEQAWNALLRHLDEVSDYYGNLHGAGEHSARVRGEMALHVAALMSSEPLIIKRVNALTTDLIARIERLFEICRNGGLIAEDADSHALAILHVHSIWGLAQALYANPRGARPVAAAFHQIRVLLEALRKTL